MESRYNKTQLSNEKRRQFCAFCLPSVSKAHRRETATQLREPRVTANLHVTGGKGGKEEGREGGKGESIGGGWLNQFGRWVTVRAEVG